MKKYTEISLLILMALPMWGFICLTSYVFLAILDAIRINYIAPFPKESIIQLSEISFSILKNNPTLFLNSLTLEEPNGIIVTISICILIMVTFVERMPGGSPLWPRVNKF